MWYRTAPRGPRAPRIAGPIPHDPPTRGMLGKVTRRTVTLWLDPAGGSPSGPIGTIASDTNAAFGPGRLEVREIRLPHLEGWAAPPPRSGRSSCRPSRLRGKTPRCRRVVPAAARAGTRWMRRARSGFGRTFTHAGTTTLFAAPRCRHRPHHSWAACDIQDESQGVVAPPSSPRAVRLTPDNCRGRSTRREIGITGTRADPQKGPQSQWTLATLHRTPSSLSNSLIRLGRKLGSGANVPGIAHTSSSKPWIDDRSPHPLPSCVTWMDGHDGGP